MSDEIFSKHISSSSELTVLATIKPGFAPCRSLITYSARMRMHLRMLGALRRYGLEGRRAGVYTGPLDSLRTLQYIRWTLIDDDTRMLLAVNFDRPLEPYIRRIVDIAGPLLDTILCHCEDFEGRCSDEGFHKFMEFATTHQAPVELFAAAAPDFTVDDADYSLRADRDIRNLAGGDTVALDAKLAGMRLRRPEERLVRSAASQPLALLDQALNIIQSFFDNAHLFADDTSPERDDLLYFRLLERLTPGFWQGLLRLIGQHHPMAVSDAFNLTRDELTGLRANVRATVADELNDARGLDALWGERPDLALLKVHEEALDWFAAPPTDRAYQPPGHPSIGGDKVQSGLPTSPQATTPRADAGCLLLLRVDDPAEGRAFLTAMDARLWPAKNADVHCNLSITHSGLKALGVDESVRRAFPTEFREGMAARAGLLGDVDVNEPSCWVWPKANWISVNGTVREGDDAPIAPDTIDLIVQLSKDTGGEHPTYTEEHPLHGDVKEIAEMAGSGVSLLGVEPMLRRYESVEGKEFVRGHLGFIDGVSQPQFAESGDFSAEAAHQVENFQRYCAPPPAPRPAPPLPDHDIGTAEREGERSLLGDLLLGHPSKFDIDLSLPFGAREAAKAVKPYPGYVDTPLLNGTFQVIRKLRVDKKKLDEAKSDSAEKADVSIQERMIGRKKDGTPLIAGHGLNGFDYAGDKNGTTVPLQSHIRRANPREADTPRILRRGFSYGPFDDGDADRGLMFIAYNARIAEQFEVIQRWLSGGNSTGLSSYHGDPLLAPRRAEGARVFRAPTQSGGVERVDFGVNPPVVLQWGVYAFTPSRNGLVMLANAASKMDVPKPATPPHQRLKSLEKSASVADWRRALEDIDDERREDTLAIWRDVRAKPGGIFPAGKYGVLVGSADGVKQVLENKAGAFSVREYDKRMRDSTGTIYLGFDDPPVHTKSADEQDQADDLTYHANVDATLYHDESAAPNEFMNASGRDWYGEAFNEARRILMAIPAAPAFAPDSAPSTPSRRVLGERFFYDLVGRLCVSWFGMPETHGVQIGGPERKDAPHCPLDLIRASFYVFWPDPPEHMKEASRDRTQKLRNEVRRYVNGLDGQTPARTLLDALKDWPDPNRRADTIVGVSSGFAGPTGGSFRFILFDWIETGLLWRLQQRVRALGAQATEAAVRDVLQPEILKSMSKRTAPDLLHREVVNRITIGGETIEAGQRVVISLRSAIEDAEARPGGLTEEDRRYFLFGGNYGPGRTALHSCPGQEIALCVMAAAFAALMKEEEIRPESSGSFSIR